MKKDSRLLLLAERRPDPLAVEFIPRMKFPKLLRRGVTHGMHFYFTFIATHPLCRCYRALRNYRTYPGLHPRLSYGGLSVLKTAFFHLGVFVEKGRSPLFTQNGRLIIITSNDWPCGSPLLFTNFVEWPLPTLKLPNT